MSKIASFFVFLIASAFAQSSPDALTNESIIQMVRQGVPAPEIIKAIAEAKSVDFRFTELQRLTDAMVPDEVFRAMAAKSKGVPVRVPPQAATPNPSQAKSQVIQAPVERTDRRPLVGKDEASSSPVGTCYFTVLAQLVDKNLNLKPLPKLRLGLRQVDATRKRPFTTSFEGRVAGDLPCGMYSLTSDEPIEFDGKRYSWDFNVRLQPGQATAIELSTDNATATTIRAASPESGTSGRVTDDLVTHFKRYEGSVVTVWSEFGRGTGFFVDDIGLVLTNQHVVGPSEYIAVQSDPEHKVRAVLLASDPEKDIAVLWVNRSGLPGTIIAPVARPGPGEVLAVEGERVFTIGSPLNQRKIMTTGIVSKVEARAIISDVNINHGNSGGPLFNSLGYVVGITTFLDTASNGPGISGIVRIEQAEGTLAAARAKLASLSPPPAALLPVEPVRPFPVDRLKTIVATAHPDVRLYTFEEGDFSVAIITPVLRYEVSESSAIAASKEKARRSRSSGVSAPNTFQPLDDLKDWAEYIGEYQPVIQIRVTPKLRETFGSALARGLTATNGVSTVPAKLRFKADFYKMILECDGKEIQPIHPGKIPKTVDVRNRFVNVTDTTYEGLYTFPADAISPNCGEVSLDIYSEKNVLKAKVKALNPKTVNRVWDDFQAYR